MEREEFEFYLDDRIAKIKAINEQYNLEKNAYIAFSGGKDSTILHYLIDLALPNNHIPRIFVNTGIEYKYVRQFVEEMALEDYRIKIIYSNVNLKKMWLKDGFPFKSKQHSHNLAIYWRNKNNLEYNLSLKRYLGLIESSTKFRCPKILEYQFKPSFNLKCSDVCCQKLKKDPMKNWAKLNNKTITLTGMRKEEGGQRASIGCVVTDKNNKLLKFHPLLMTSQEWEDAFIKFFNIKLCKLYYKPFNFKRTGCKGCPFSLDLQHQLDVMKELLPNERKQCEILWKPVYDEYRRLGYRLKKLNLFDFMEE